MDFIAQYLLSSMRSKVQFSIFKVQFRSHAFIGYCLVSSIIIYKVHTPVDGPLVHLSGDTVVYAVLSFRPMQCNRVPFAVPIIIMTIS